MFQTHQVVVVVPEVYELPPLPRWYDDAMTPVAWLGRLDWTILLPPGACIDYTQRLVLRGLGSLVLIGLLPLASLVHEILRACCSGRRASVSAALLSCLPAMLFAAFCLCPSVSRAIFSAWGCESYEFSYEARRVKALPYCSCAAGQGHGRL